MINYTQLCKSLVAEEELEEVDLGFGSQEPRPISISANLTEKEKLELVLPLKEFKDVFAWDYSEMSGPWADCTHVECGPAGQANGPAY